MRPTFHGHRGAALRRAVAVSAEARATGAPVDEMAEQMATRSQADEPRFHRRTLLKGMGVAGTAAVAPVTVVADGKRSTPRVVIVGGGLAGIRCAHKLWTQRKLASTIYEWDDRLGGRVHTIRGAFANDQIVEACGQFISSEHHSMLR
ncbi:MAG TPA: NAD(P)-binding protein, partial [Acidimicrobiales bacterium]|nr:NAD(P)-binding protein [Acidimicrobiales bacterium]